MVACRKKAHELMFCLPLYYTTKQLICQLTKVTKRTLVLDGIEYALFDERLIPQFARTRGHPRIESVLVLVSVLVFVSVLVSVLVSVSVSVVEQCYSRGQQCYSRSQQCCNRRQQCCNRRQQCYSRGQQCYSRGQHSTTSIRINNNCI